MSLEAQAPKLDTRTLAEIKRQALLRIPRYTPEWTDWNESDPGVTLVELFAWLTEMMFYQMNQVPDLMYIKFLQLLNMELRPAEPAVAHLEFIPQPGVEVAPVPKGAQVSAASQGGDPVVFENQAGLDLIRVALTDVQVFDGAAFTVVSTANQEPGTKFRPFGWQPTPGSALYLGFTPGDPPARAPIFPQRMSWRVFLPIDEVAGKPIHCEQITLEPVPPVKLEWEYRPQDNSTRWKRLDVFQDGSAAFTREGAIQVRGPVDPALTQEGRVVEKRYWLRIRIAERSYPPGLAPVVDMLRPNVVEAKNLVTVREELVGFSQGTPDQVFSLQRRPVERASLKLEVREGDEAAQAWEMVNDFLASGNVASHYTLNSATGEIKFGDGRRGRIPVAGAEIVARTYRYGGGEAGNVPAKAINSPRSALLGVDKVENIRKAVGGRDEQAVDEFLKEAPAMLRCRNRAVSIEDYRMLAEEAGGVGKAKALANYHPDHPGVEVPGAVTVVIVPDNDDRTPKPSPDQLEAVCRYLDERRLLTTELYVKGPEYLPVKVAAKVAVEPYASFAEVKSNIILAIDAALDPLGRKQINPQAGSSSAAGNGVGQSTAGTGEPSGRDFGLDLYPTSLFSVIQNVPNVKAIESLAVNGLEGQELNRPIELKPDMLVYGSTDHEITIVPYEEDGQQ